MSNPPNKAAYDCPFCRMPSDGASGTSCPHCGAPVDIRLRVSDSGWIEQPPIRDMARIRFGHSTCQISGAYVQVAEMKLHEGDWVYFSHHVFLHADRNVRLENLPMKGGWGRVMAGLPLIMMRATGPGHVAFSADAPGDTLAVPLAPSQAIDVVEHQFLVATQNVTYAWDNSPVWFVTQDGNDSEYHYPVGRYMDRFTATDGNGLLLLHAPGNTFIRDLTSGQHILVQPGALVWKDRSVHMSLHFEQPRGRWSRYDVATWLSLRGPGRVAIKSVYEHPEFFSFSRLQMRRGSPATTHQW